MRQAEIKRSTRETDLELKLELDGSGTCRADLPGGFFRHMLETICRHGFFDLEIRGRGDVEVDPHHLVEDCGLVLGQAMRQAIGDMRDLERYASVTLPMDESLAAVHLDLSGRPCLVFRGRLSGLPVGDFPSTLLADFLQAFCSTLGAALHVEIFYGRSEHHQIEAICKALGRALRRALAPAAVLTGQLPSCKELL